jgi:hypothetical protein
VSSGTSCNNEYGRYMSDLNKGQYDSFMGEFVMYLCFPLAAMRLCLCESRLLKFQYATSGLLHDGRIGKVSTRFPSEYEFQYISLQVHLQRFRMWFFMSLCTCRCV